MNKTVFNQKTKKKKDNKNITKNKTVIQNDNRLEFKIYFLFSSENIAA